MGLNFNALAQHVTVPDSPSLAATATYSFSAWVLRSPTQFADQGTIYSKTNPVLAANDFGPFFQIGIPAFPRKIVMWIGGTAPAAWYVSTADIPSTFDYQHVGGSFDGTTVRLYINGVLDSTHPGITGVPNNPAFPARIGGRPDLLTAGLRAALEDLRYYNRVLTDGEMSTIYATQGRDGIVNGMQARWFMRGDVGMVPGPGEVQDETPNGNNGSQTGALAYVPQRQLGMAQRLP